MFVLTNVGLYNNNNNNNNRKVESELLPALRKFGIRFYAFSPVRVEEMS